MNFNVNFNVFLSKYIVHPLVKIKNNLRISRRKVQLLKKRSNIHHAVLLKLNSNQKLRKYPETLSKKKQIMTGLVPVNSVAFN